VVFLRRREPEKPWPKVGERSLVRSPRTERARRGRTGDLQRAVDRLAEREHQAGMEVLDVQLVAQMCAGGPGYERWRQHVERSWQRHNQRTTGRKWTTAAWPRALTPDHVAVLLLPLPAGRVGFAARGEALAADPVFTSGVPLRGAPRTDPVLELLMTWTLNPAAAVTARLAPPVIETIVQGRVSERWVETFGVRWPLPPPDGV
jgi:hypothetical protein